jgi:hypothetical protein
MLFAYLIEAALMAECILGSMSNEKPLSVGDLRISSISLKDTVWPLTVPAGTSQMLVSCDVADLIVGRTLQAPKRSSERK